MSTPTAFVLLQLIGPPIIGWVCGHAAYRGEIPDWIIGVFAGIATFTATNRMLADIARYIWGSQ